MSDQDVHTSPETGGNDGSNEILTFGCRLNAWESEVMRGHAREAGLEGAVIVNTCAVTNEAVRQARQAIRRAHRNNPEAPIIVTGCAAQINPAEFSDMPEVTRVIGNDDKMKADTFKPDILLGGDDKLRQKWMDPTGAKKNTTPMNQL